MALEYVFEETVTTNSNPEQPDTVRVSVLAIGGCIVLHATDGSSKVGEAFVAVSDVRQLVETLLRAQAVLEQQPLYKLIHS